MLRVLLLEDDDFDALLVERELRTSGIDFLLTHVGSFDAFRRELSASFDVVLADYNIPNMPKGAALAVYLETGLDAPFIVLSGALPEEAVADLLKAGATDFVNKDRLERLPLAIRRAVEEADRRRELARAQEEILAAKEAAEAANTAKDRFLAALSHELRAPLTPLLMGIDEVLLEPDLPPSVLVALEGMRKNLRLEIQLIDDLLDVSALANGKVRFVPEATDLRELVENAVEVCYGESRERGVSLHTLLPETPVWVHVDPRRTQQAIWNLVRNALKFTDRGGRVALRMKRAGDRVCLEVSDTGVGISREEVERIFHPFAQGESGLKPGKGGLGLGLAIAREIVERQGGTLAADSDGLGKGATFSIDLPMAPRPTTSKASGDWSTALSASSTSHRGRRLLLVEDHPDTARVLRLLLETQGFDVDTAGTFTEASEKLSVGNYEVLVSDIGLPDGSGLDLMRGPVPVGLVSVALSGYGRDADVAQALDAGFHRQLTKPVPFDILLRTINEIVPAGRPVSAPSS